MEAGVIQVAADEDFEKLWKMVSDNSWKLEYQHEEIFVWSKHSNSNDVKIIKVKATFKDDMWLLFDLLMDGEYRTKWDSHMVESFTLGYINPNNDVGYYAMSCPPPIQNRDFVIQRSWLATPKKISILNQSVTHKDLPPKKYYIRGVSHITGYVIEPFAPGKSKGCTLSYVSATDPRGAIPTWAVNKGTQYFAPKMIKTLQKASSGYLEWKQQHRPGFKPWLYPEQMDYPKLLLEQNTLGNGAYNIHES